MMLRPRHDYPALEAALETNTDILESLGIISAQLRVSLKPFEPSQYHRIEGLRGALNWAPIIPRYDNLSGSGCKFFQSNLEAMCW